MALGPGFRRDERSRGLRWAGQAPCGPSPVLRGDVGGDQAEGAAVVRLAMLTMMRDWMSGTKPRAA
jgi:hypothetical protein